MDCRNMFDLLKKIKRLHDGATTEGERKAAEEAYRHIVNKHGIDVREVDFAEEKEAWHQFSYRTKRQYSLLIQVICSVIGCHVSNYKDKRAFYIKTTTPKAVEIEYKFDYFKRLYEDEESVLFEAFLYKHDLFSHDDNGEGSGDFDEERLARIASMVSDLQDSNLLKALPGKTNGDA